MNNWLCSARFVKSGRHRKSGVDCIGKVVIYDLDLGLVFAPGFGTDESPSAESLSELGPLPLEEPP